MRLGFEIAIKSGGTFCFCAKCTKFIDDSFSYELLEKTGGGDYPCVLTLVVLERMKWCVFYTILIEKMKIRVERLYSYL